MITIANHFPTHRMFYDNGTSPVAPVRACLRLAFGDAPLPITVVWAPALVSFAGIIDAVRRRTLPRDAGLRRNFRAFLDSKVINGRATFGQIVAVPLLLDAIMAIWESLWLIIR